MKCPSRGRFSLQFRVQAVSHRLKAELRTLIIKFQSHFPWKNSIHPILKLSSSSTNSHSAREGLETNLICSSTTSQFTSDAAPPVPSRFLTIFSRCSFVWYAVSRFFLVFRGFCKSLSFPITSPFSDTDDRLKTFSIAHELTHACREKVLNVRRPHKLPRHCWKRASHALMQAKSFSMTCSPIMSG